MAPTQPGSGRPHARCVIRLAQWQRNLIGVLIAAFVSILGFNAAFPFLPLYVQELGVSDAGQAALWSGVIGSVAGVLGALVAPVWGHLADRRGRKPMLVRATAGAAVGLVIMGLAPSLFMLLLGRVAFGLMAGTVPAANPLIAANTPPEHIAGAMGMLQSSLYVSNAVGPILGGVLASTVGYRVTFLITAALYVASAIPAIFLIRERFTRPVEEAPFVASMRANYAEVFRRGDLLIVVFASFLAFCAVSSLQPVLPLHIADLVGRADAERATGLAAGLQGLAGTVAAFFVGRVTRRFGYGAILRLAPPLLAATFLGMWVADSYAVLLVMLFVAGAVQGLSATTLSAMVALRAPRERAGAIFGVVSSINSFAFSGAPLLAGWAAAVFGLRAVFPLCALMACGMAVLSILAAREGAPEAELARAAARPQRSTSR